MGPPTYVHQIFSAGLGETSDLVAQAQAKTLRRGGSIVVTKANLLYLKTVDTQLAACTEGDDSSPCSITRSDSELLQLTNVSHSCDDSSNQEDPFTHLPLVTEATLAASLMTTLVDAEKVSAAAAASQVAWDRRMEECNKYGRRLFSQPGS